MALIPGGMRPRIGGGAVLPRPAGASGESAPPNSVLDGSCSC